MPPVACEEEELIPPVIFNGPGAPPLTVADTAPLLEKELMLPETVSEPNEFTLTSPEECPIPDDVAVRLPVVREPVPGRPAEIKIAPEFPEDSADELMSPVLTPLNDLTTTFPAAASAPDEVVVMVPDGTESASADIATNVPAMFFAP